MLAQGQSESYKVRSFHVVSEALIDDKMWCTATDGTLNTDVRKNSSSIISDDSKQTLCPNFYQGAIVWAAWDPTNEYWVDLNVDARRMVEHTDCNEFPDKLVANAGGTSSGGSAAAAALTAGNKGEKGDSGVGSKGDKGDKGDKGNKGNKGDKGLKGDKGNKGQKGQKGLKGQKGQKGIRGEKGKIVDLADSPVVSVDGIEFGARLTGICVNGEWKYVYVFASIPQST
jgi:hypothetical protein